MYDQLKDIFENINNWLRFAEAKNAAIVAFNGAIAMGAHSLLKESSPPLPSWYLWMVVTFVALSTFCALVSFHPQTKIRRWWKKIGSPLASDNLYFYGHIEKYSNKQFLQELATALSKDQERNLNTAGGNTKTFSRSEINLAEQIVTNSQIASRKYVLFKVALFFLMSALFTPIVALFVVLLFSPND
jgi:hypothetical protein